jgi:arsenate reductase
MTTKLNVLVLCSKNSARSQMAEGLLRKYAGDHFSVYSAGLDSDRVHPMVPPVMAEIGIDVSEQRSKNVKEYLGHLPVHYLIVVCANAEDRCPSIFPGMRERFFWPFDDPAAAEGSEEEQLAVFRRVRDEISKQLQTWLAEMGVTPAEKA